MLLYICIYNQFKRKQIIGKTTNFSAIKNSRTKKFVKVKISKIKVSIFNKYEVLIMIRIFANNLVYIQDEDTFNMYVLDPKSHDFLYELSISKTDDYHIGCEVAEELSECNRIQILINSDNLLYQGFLSFMGNEKQIIIQDDLGYIRFGKQVIISKEDENINLLFEYKEKQCLNEFGIHVINVVYDGRSLIDQQEKDTKKRLYYLCDKLFETFNQYEPNYDGPILKKVKK